MTDSGLALSINVSKPYFIELLNSYIKDLRFNASIDIKAIGEIEIFIDSCQVIEIQTIDDHWELDLSTIVKIKSEKRHISLAGITKSSVILELFNSGDGNIFIQVGDINFDWQALKTDVNGSRKTGVDNLTRSILNLAENTISRKLCDLLTSKINGLIKPYTLYIPPLNLFKTEFQVNSRVSELYLEKLEVVDQRIRSIIQFPFDANVRDKKENGEIKINKVSLIKDKDDLENEFNISLEVTLSDVFVNMIINRHLEIFEKDTDFPIDLEKVNLLAEKGNYRVQIETGSKAAELIEFDIAFIGTEFSNFPEIELSDFQIEGKGIVGVIAKQFLRAYKRKLSALISQKWLDFISSQMSDLKSEGIQYKWKELDIHIPLKNIDIVSHQINPQKGLILNIHISTGQISITSN